MAQGVKAGRLVIVWKPNTKYFMTDEKYLLVHLGKNTIGETIISTLRKSAKDLGLETLIDKVVTSVDLKSGKMDCKKRVGIYEKHLRGRLATRVAYVCGSETGEGFYPEKLYSDINIFISKSKNFNLEKYLNQVNKYLSQNTPEQPNN